MNKWIGEARPVADGRQFEKRCSCGWRVVYRTFDDKVLGLVREHVASHRKRGRKS